MRPAGAAAARSFVPISGLRVAQRARAEEDAQERCDLCSTPIPAEPEHRHLLDIDRRRALCVCQACRILFDEPNAGSRNRRLISNRRLFLPDLALTDAQWEELRVPVKMAFFVKHDDGRAAAYYPSPMGATESPLQPETWNSVIAAAPVLASLAPEVEALLVNRLSEVQQCFLVGIDVCFELVGLVRVAWRGFMGGSEVWEALDGFFAELREQAVA